MEHDYFTDMYQPIDMGGYSYGKHRHKGPFYYHSPTIRNGFRQPKTSKHKFQTVQKNRKTA
jgi:hypothetical protein